MSGNLRSMARSLGLGRLYLHLVSQPVRRTLEYFTRHGGPWGRARLRADMAAMEAAEQELRTPPILGDLRDDSPGISFLTGQEFWYQTAFCFHSLLHHGGVPLRAVLYDDGTLTPRIAERARTLFPGTQIHWKRDLDARVAEHLPPSRFPTIHRVREKQPLFRKITDLHAGSAGWHLLLDSDMLFFGKPVELLDWIAAPRNPIYMVDVKNAYGFPHEDRYALVHKPIHDRINIGVFGLRSEDVDFAELERWLSVLLGRQNQPYNVTQGICSMILAGRRCTVLPEETYIVLPVGKEAQEPCALLHHYVAESKPAYFGPGWRWYLRQLEGAGGPSE